MTRVITITEYNMPHGLTITARDDRGNSATLQFDNDEAVLTTSDSEGEPSQCTIHPDDARAEMFAFMELL